MSMKVKIISSAGDLEKLEPFHVDNLLWGTKESPKTYGYLGFVPRDGFYLKMICEESDPLRAYTKDFDPVYRDSAMEAFFQFEARRERNGLPAYLNFEVNANGALLASSGKERVYRSYFTAGEMKMFRCKAVMETDRWYADIRIPISVLERIYGPLKLGKGSVFTCNFYKLSEDREIEHYASYSPILTAVPSFHLPEYFAQAELVD